MPIATRVSSFQYAGDPTNWPALNPTPVILARFESAEGHQWTAELRFPGVDGDDAADLFFEVVGNLPRKPWQRALAPMITPDSFYVADADAQALIAKDFGCYTVTSGTTGTTHRPSDAWNAA